MKLPRRKFLHLAAGAAALPAMSRIASALDYPTRPVRFVVGFPAGSATDIVARLIAQSLSGQLGQQFIVDDRPGAGSNLAAEVVVRAEPDGYTLLQVASPNAINATLYDNLSFNFIRDIAPVAGIMRYPYVMVVNSSFPAKSVPEFIAYAKANPGKINMASAGNGTAPHVFGELFMMMTGVKMLHVPYRGSYFSDLIGGQVQVVFSPLPSTIGYIKAGTLAGLGRNHCDALGCTAGHSDRWRFCAGLRSQQLAGRRRAKENARSDHRQAEQRDQCCHRRTEYESATCRFGRHDTFRLACRIRQTHR